MVRAATDAWLLGTFGAWPTPALKRALVGWTGDLADAYVDGAERVEDLERRIAILKRVLRERGEAFTPGRLFD